MFSRSAHSHCRQYALIAHGTCDTLITTIIEKGVNMKHLASYIEHTLLKPDAEEKAVLKLCKEADEHKFATVCVNSSRVELCAKKLADSEVKVCSVIGFPLGAALTSAKRAEAAAAIEAGADEIDMVINIGKLKDGDVEYVEEDIRQVKEACGEKVLKVIIEACLLSQEQKVLACQISQWAGADFVKTSTGFSTGGATVDDVVLMKRIVGTDLQIKAAGGIRSADDAEAMITAGASRLGTSGGIAIIHNQGTGAEY